MKIEFATHDDIPDIVTLHSVAFQGFFLTILGKKFLSLLYRDFISYNNSICLIAKNDSKEAIGFAIGTLTPNIFFKEIFKNQWYKFLIAALPALIKRPVFVFKKLASAIFYRGDMPSIQGSSKPLLLSSIAVTPESKNLGVGKSLLNRFLAVAQERGADCIYLTTDQSNNDHVNRFYLSHGFLVNDTLQKPGGRMMYRYVKYFRD